MTKTNKASGRKSGKKGLFGKIERLFQKDANGKTNRTGIVLFFGALFLPLIILEGVKVGFYAVLSGSHSTGLDVFFRGLTTPLVQVIATSHQRTFGQNGFDASYLGLLLLAYGAVVTLSWISADMMKNKSDKKDGDMQFGDIEEYNKKFAYPLGEEGVSEPKEPTASKPGNMIISEHARYSLSGTSYTYSCALIVGSTGSAKTFRYVKPNIMQMNASFVCTDPKTELIRDCGQMLSNNGYNVLLFNLKKGEQRFSCRYNPFAYIRDEQDVVLTVDAFLDATQEDKGTGGDPFFPIAEKNFYYALFYYVFTKHRDANDGSVGTLKEVYELYSKANESDQPAGKRTKEQQAAQLENEFDKSFREVSERDPSNPCLSFYKTFKNGSPKTKQSILISVGIKLWFLSVPETANLLSGDDLNLGQIGERKTALFIAIPTDNKSFRCISAMLFTQLFQELYYQGETLNARTYLLKKGLCVAARSKEFIDGTESQTKAHEELVLLQKRFQGARIEYEADLAKKDHDLAVRLDTKNDLGIKPWPKYRVVDKDDHILETFNTKKAAEEYLDAGQHGSICQCSGLAVRTRFLLDEFYAIGKIGGFEEKIATFRSLNISADIICQGLQQLKEMYDDHEGKVTGNCDLRICLGVNAYDDAKAFSDMVGQTTVRTQSANIKNNNLISMPDGGSMSDSAEMLVRPEWLMNKMQGDEELVLTRTTLPLKDKKYNPLQHPNWGQLYNDHDPEGTAQNKFPFRNIFCIDQKKENLIQTVLDKPEQPPTAKAVGGSGRRYDPNESLDPPNKDLPHKAIGPSTNPYANPYAGTRQSRALHAGAMASEGSSSNRPLSPRRQGPGVDGSRGPGLRQPNFLRARYDEQRRAGEKAREKAQKKQTLQTEDGKTVSLASLTTSELDILAGAVHDGKAKVDPKTKAVGLIDEDFGDLYGSFANESAEN